MARRTYYDPQGARLRRSDPVDAFEVAEILFFDIDKAIEIVRNTAEETEVVPNPTIGFCTRSRGAGRVRGRDQAAPPEPLMHILKLRTG